MSQKYDCSRQQNGWVLGLLEWTVWWSHRYCWCDNAVGRILPERGSDFEGVFWEVRKVENEGCAEKSSWKSSRHVEEDKWESQHDGQQGYVGLWVCEGDLKFVEEKRSKESG